MGDRPGRFNEDGLEFNFHVFRERSVSLIARLRKVKAAQEPDVPEWDAVFSSLEDLVSVAASEGVKAFKRKLASEPDVRMLARSVTFAQSVEYFIEMLTKRDIDARRALSQLNPLHMMKELLQGPTIFAYADLERLKGGDRKEGDGKDVAAMVRQWVLTGRISALDEGVSDGGYAPDIDEPVPVTIWLPTDDNALAVQAAVHDLLTEVGLELTDAPPSEYGSWFRRLWYSAKKVGSSPELKERMAKVEHALELHSIEKIQAEVDSTHAESVAKLLNALQDSPNAVIQLGSVLLVKVDGLPVVRTLTPLDMIVLKRNPELSKDPQAILAALQTEAEKRTQQNGDSGHDLVQPRAIDGQHTIGP